MAIVLKIILLATITKCCFASNLPKPGYARTYLKVSRSLPGTTEEMKVRTSEGNLATLIVKKRNKTDTPNTYELLKSASEASQLNSNIYSFGTHQMEPINPIANKRANKMAADISESNDKENNTGTSKRASRTIKFDKTFETQYKQYAILPHQPILRTNIGANRMINIGGKNVPDEVTINTEIDIKSSPSRSIMVIGKDGIPIIYGRRVPDDPIDKFQTWRNARVINNTLIPNNSDDNLPSTDNNNFYKRSDNIRDERGVKFDWKPESHVLKYQKQEDDLNLSLEKLPKLMAHYPNYNLQESNTKIAPLSLKTGSRAPVLQYAHPEFGAQSVKTTKYFLENPYLEKIKKNDNKYASSNMRFVNDYSNKMYPNKYYHLKSSTEPPLWIKLSEDFKSQINSGVEKVSQLTKPIINPIMDVTYKSLNSLGLVKLNESNKRYDPVTSGSSMLIPALGLVASGAALGLGAVAVGRYFDVNALTRFNNVEKMRLFESYVPLNLTNEAGKKQTNSENTLLNVNNNNNLPPANLVVFNEMSAKNDKPTVDETLKIQKRRKRYTNQVRSVKNVKVYRSFDRHKLK